MKQFIIGFDDQRQFHSGLDFLNYIDKALQKRAFEYDLYSLYQRIEIENFTQDPSYLDTISQFQNRSI